MFLSVRQPGIADARTQAAISKARSQNGVHIYFNEPHTKVNNEFNTPLADMAGTKSTYLTWTSMFRAKADGPVFGLALRVDGDISILAYGVSETSLKYYAARKQQMVQWTDGQQHYSDASLKKGQYAVLTIYIKYPPQGAVYEPIKISLKNAELAYITQWDTVIIQGQYAALNKKYKGILVGVSADKKSAAFYDFASYQGDNTTVTIRLTVGFNDVAVSTDKEQRVFNIAIGPDDNAWLLVDNINISNLDIHTTAKIEK